MIRVLIAEDSSTIRFLLKRILSGDEEIQVIGEAANGEEAIRLAAELKPDLITMDIRMPKKNGFEATQEIMRICPTPILVISASVQSEDLNIAFNAIKAGALDIVEKPKGSLSADFEKIGKRIIQKIKILSEVKVIRQRPLKSSQVSSIVTTEALFNNQNDFVLEKDFMPEIIGIVSSTGGPKALLNILKELDPDFPIPICIVQHITPGFGQGLVDWLDNECSIKVKFAENMEELKGRCVYFAKDDYHMTITEKKRIQLNTQPAVLGLRPYGNYFLDSLASVYAKKSIGIILTGMGRDGAEGVKRMKDKGALTIGQDEATSVVYGMPREALEIGGLTLQLSLDKIGMQLKELVSHLYLSKD